jgi:hypothetical protein
VQPSQETLIISSSESEQQQQQQQDPTKILISAPLDRSDVAVDNNNNISISTSSQYETSNAFLTQPTETTNSTFHSLSGDTFPPQS